MKQIKTVPELMEQMSEPSAEVKKLVSGIDGKILVLGAGGKMGPTLTQMLIRAGGKVIAVDLYPDEGVRKYLDDLGAETIQCDLFDDEQLSRLPYSENVFLFVGTKFGATGNEPFVWSMNAFLPARIMGRYPKSRIVYLSSGNVYRFTDVNSAGATENDPVEPIGEYAMSRLGAERMVAYQCQRNQSPTTIVRLFYATELRYGIVHDIAQKVYNDLVIDLSMGHVNQIWQGDACDYLIRCLEISDVPARTINLTGEKVLTVRDIALKLGVLMKKQPRFDGQESANALLGDSSALYDRFGKPGVDEEQIISWVADWVMRGGESLGKPTKYEKRDGKF